MTSPRVSSTDGSTAVGGDANAPIVNVTASDGSTVNVRIEQQIARELPSFLGAVIVVFSQQSLSEYGLGARRPLPSEVIDKIKYNNLPEDHRVITDFCRHGLVLERAYLGVEQQNADARYLVRRKAAVAYESALAVACEQASIPMTGRVAFARTHSGMLVDAVIDQLLQSYAASQAIKVEHETAHLAVSLIVADAVVECEVLERP